MSDVSRRYAVLHHTGVETPHFDFLFEDKPGDERLTTFRCPRWPLQLDDEVEELEEHRRAYLDYEGPVSGDRGAVRREEAGRIVITTLASDPPTLALRLLSDGCGREIVFTEVGATTRWLVTTTTDSDRSNRS